MRKVKKSLKEHIKNPVTTLASCWLLILKDGTKFGFTDYTDNITYDNLTYHHSNMISTSSVESYSSLSADNFEIEGVLNSDLILEEDLLSGKYDKAYIEYFLINYTDPSQGKILIKSGNIYEVRLLNNRFFAEVRSLGYEFNKQTRSIYSESCRAEFCDSKCMANREMATVIVEITNIISENEIEIDEIIKNPNIYRNSKMQIGDNERSYLIREVHNNRVILQQNSDVFLKKGEKILLFPQCDKSFLTCCSIFDNALNFRGEPHVPGIDEINKTAGTFK